MSFLIVKTLLSLFVCFKIFMDSSALLIVYFCSKKLLSFHCRTLRSSPPETCEVYFTPLQSHSRNTSSYNLRVYRIHDFELIFKFQNQWFLQSLKEEKHDLVRSERKIAHTLLKLAVTTAHRNQKVWMKTAKILFVEQLVEMHKTMAHISHWAWNFKTKAPNC